MTDPAEFCITTLKSQFRGISNLITIDPPCLQAALPADLRVVPRQDHSGRTSRRRPCSIVARARARVAYLTSARPDCVCATSRRGIFREPNRCRYVHFQFASEPTNRGFAERGAGAPPALGAGCCSSEI